MSAFLPEGTTVPDEASSAELLASEVEDHRPRLLHKLTAASHEEQNLFQPMTCYEASDGSPRIVTASYGSPALQVRSLVIVDIVERR
jgi:hypothetical protein